MTTPDSDAFGRVLEAGYARLPERFYARVRPTPVVGPRLLAWNEALAAELGLRTDALDPRALAELVAGNALPAGAEAIATVYAGHQFGQFVPQLGDGRAILLGELRDRAGRPREIQLKGSGPTPFSRAGDGRAALGPVLREYLVSEAMHALGIPSTRTLAAAATGESVLRERALPGAVLARVASTHVRVGTFEYFAARNDRAALDALCGHVLHRLYPHLVDSPRPALGLLETLIERQAGLVAQWMAVGFVHGVMNTDNTSVAGETIDYGPCAFLDAYDPATVFSSIDRFGRYAYANQPHAAHWNLARFAETLLPLIDPDVQRAADLANQALARFESLFETRRLALWRRKLGLAVPHEGDAELAGDWLALLAANGADFTVAFRSLARALPERAADAAAAPGIHPGDLLADAGAFDPWMRRWHARLALEPTTAVARAQAMDLANPALIPRNHRIEQAIVAAESGDFSQFTALARSLARPFAEPSGPFADLALPPQPQERVRRTFCGT